MVFCSQKKKEKKKSFNKWLLTDVGTDEQQADVWNNNNPHQRTPQKWMNDMSMDQTYIDVQKCE
jgi:hypothetical protein